MKKQLALYYSLFIIFFLLISLARGWMSTDFLMLWIGGAVGAILPDIDHLIYIYYLRPHELTSQRAAYMLSKKEVFATFSLLASTRSERKVLIFHNALFQIIFYIFAFLILSSSSSLFGRGLVLAFLLHLLVDQYLDFVQLDSIEHWFRNLKVQITKEKSTLYWVGALLVLLVFGFIF